MRRRRGERGDRERGTRLRKDRGWALQGKRYLRGWKIDSNLATLLAVLSEHLPAAAMVHNHIILLPGVPWSSPPRYVHHRCRRRRRRRCFLPSFLLPAFPLRPFSSRGLVRTHPYTSRKLISGLRRVRSRAL